MDSNDFDTNGGVNSSNCVMIHENYGFSFETAAKLLTPQQSDMAKDYVTF